MDRSGESADAGARVFSVSLLSFSVSKASRDLADKENVIAGPSTMHQTYKVQATVCWGANFESLFVQGRIQFLVVCNDNLTFE